MDEQSARNLAAQLRQPTGEDGVKTAFWMNQGNKQINLDTLNILDASINDCILEIGMGNGFFVDEILKKHPSITYTGCDFSELMIEESNRINKPWVEKGSAEFIHSSAEALPFRDNTFNKIFTINTIYFWEDVPKVFDELKRVLKKDGTLIITIRPKRLMEKFPFIQYGFNLFSKEDLESLLVKHGFVIRNAFEIREPDYEVNGQTMHMENLIIEATL